MLFHSTRGKDSGKSFEEVLMQGLAIDGGLFMPESWPQIDIEHIKQLESFIDVAKYIVPLFTKSSFTDEEVKELLDHTWHDFSDEDFALIHNLDESKSILELKFKNNLNSKVNLLKTLARLISCKLYLKTNYTSQ